MEQAVQGLSFLSNRYPFVEKEPWHSNGIRYFPVIGYNVYYWVNEERAKVYIIDVVSQKMRQDKRLIESITASFREDSENASE